MKKVTVVLLALSALWIGAHAMNTGLGVADVLEKRNSAICAIVG